MAVWLAILSFQKLQAFTSREVTWAAIACDEQMVSMALEFAVDICDQRNLALPNRDLEGILAGLYEVWVICRRIQMYPQNVARTIPSAPSRPPMTQTRGENDKDNKDDDDDDDDDNDDDDDDNDDNDDEKDNKEEGNKGGKNDEGKNDDEDEAHWENITIEDARL